MAERAARVLALLFASFLITSAAEAAPSPFAYWAAVVVAGDHEIPKAIRRKASTMLGVMFRAIF